MAMSDQAAAPARDGRDYAQAFLRDAASRTPSQTNVASDTLVLHEWGLEDWQKLLATTTVKAFKPSEVVIQRGAADRALYFVAAGVLEVGVTHFDGVTTSPLARIGAGSVIGEQSFFDGEGRSANVWAVTEGTLLRWEYETYKKFGSDEPRLARDLLFGVACVLSRRLRPPPIRVRR